MNLIEAKHFSFSTRDGKRVLQSGLSFELAPRHLLWVHGANGTGKSTFLDVLMRRQAFQGSLQLKTLKKETHLVPQLEMSALHVPMTLKEYITLSQKDAFKKFSWLNEKMPPPLAQTLWNSASGGERRRAILLRALIRHPKLLLLDEPLNHLDKASKLMTFELLKNYLEEPSISPSVVFVSHEDIHSYLERLQIPFSTLELGGSA